MSYINLNRNPDNAIFVKRDDKGNSNLEVSFDHSGRPIIKILDSYGDISINNLNVEEAQWLVDTLQDVIKLTKEEDE